MAYGYNYRGTHGDNCELDNLAMIQGVTRNRGKKSTVDVAISANADTNIPIGFEIIDTQGNSWLATTSTDIKSGTTETIKFESAQAGKFVVPANGVWSQAQIDPSITTIANGSPAIAGGVDETDQQLRDRLQNVIAQGSKFGNITNIYQALDKLTNTNGDSAFFRISVIENETDNTLSTGQTPHSVWIILEKNGTVTDEDIARAIYNSKPAGINTYSTTNNIVSFFPTIPVTGGTISPTYYFKIDIFAQVPIGITINLKSVGTPTLTEDEIKDYIIKNLVLEPNKPVVESDIEFLLYPLIKGQYTIKNTQVSGVIDAPNKIGTLQKTDIIVRITP